MSAQMKLTRPGLLELTAKHEEPRTKEKQLQAQVRRQKRASKKKKDKECIKLGRNLDLGVATLGMLAPDLGWIPKFVEEASVGESAEEFTERVCEKFLHSSDAELTALLSAGESSERRQLQRARSFSTQYNLKTWVLDQNKSKCVAPTIGDCIQRRDELSKRLDFTDSAADNPAFSLGASAGYKWLNRFKRKWKASMQQCGAREHVPVEQTRKKALREKHRAPT